MPPYLYDIKMGTIVEVNKYDIMKKLYYLEYRVPTDDDITKFMTQDSTNHIMVDFFKNATNDAIKKIKKFISKVEGDMPLFDIVSQNIYIVDKHNVYDNVMYKNYRFPKTSLIEKLAVKRQKLEDMSTSDPITLRKLKKLNLLIEFMNYFHIPTLYNTYIQVFYKYSPQVGQEITVCNKPSFSSHLAYIKPYFTKDEIIAIAKNMGVLSPTISHIPLAELCNMVQTNEMSYNMLQLHKKHILDNNKLGLVQYYTLQGSWYINQYLRNMTDYTTKNVYLESIIEPMWQLVRESPPFDKPYIFYRFIKVDTYLFDIKLNDVYTEPGFMSTTHGPFYRSDLYQFGFILVKVKIPANIRGIGLCLETISHFPEEQEIIFPPQSKFRLIAKNENCVFFHTDPTFTSKIKTRYEFEWVSGSDPIFNRRQKPPQKEPISFLKISKPNTISLDEKVRHFIRNYVDNMQQFNIILSNKHLTISAEWYDSTAVYKNFYALTTKSGFSLYTFYQGYTLFIIEIGENENKQNEMHVNFHLKYSALDVNKIIGDDVLITFFASVAHYFDINIVYIYASYLNCDSFSPTPVVQTTVKQRGFDFMQNIVPIVGDMKWKGYGGDTHRKKRRRNRKMKNMGRNMGVNMGVNMVESMGRNMESMGRNMGESMGESMEESMGANMETNIELKKDRENRIEEEKKHVVEITNADVIMNEIGGNYCLDIFQYLKYGIKKYSETNVLNVELQPKFSYFDLDLLKSMNVGKVLDKNDRDELYQIYDKYYSPKHEKHDVSSFYLWLKENKCYMIALFIKKLDRIFPEGNPFNNPYYIFDAPTYLYNRGLITVYPSHFSIVKKLDVLGRNEYRR